MTDFADRLAPIDLMVFDKDGTLIDFHGMWGGWAFSLAEALEAATGLRVRGALLGALGVDPRSGVTRARGTLAATPMGRIRELTVDLLLGAGLAPAAAETVVSRAWTPPDPVALAVPLTDLRSLLGSLRTGGPAAGRRIAIATTDDRAPTERTIEALGLGDLVDGIVCADDGVPVKPAPDMVLRLCTLLGVPPARTAVIGDSQSDLRMGRAAGAGLVVGVLSGVGRRRDLVPLADVVVPSVAALTA